MSAKPETADLGPGGSKSRDPKLCPPYTQAIFKYHYQVEVEDIWKIDLSTVASSVSPDKRRDVVLNLLTKAHQLDLSTSTVIHATYMMDSFLASSKNSSDDIFLISMACLLMATKYGDTQMTKASDYKVARKSISQILEMESLVFEKLNFNIWPPTVATFLRKFVQALNVTKTPEFEIMSSYLAELSLTSLDFYRYRPSCVAAAVTFLTANIIDKNGDHWPDEMMEITGYRVIDLKPCVLEFEKIQNGTAFAQKFEGVRPHFELVKAYIKYFFPAKEDSEMKSIKVRQDLKRRREETDE